MFQIVVVISIFLLPIVYTKDCVLRDFGNEGHVCVCNTTYCDDFAPLLKEQGVNAVTVVETNRKGDRFKRSFITFNSTNSANSTIKHTITIDSSKRYQKILGFGGAFTDSTVLNLAQAKELGDNIMKDYFSENGLEYNMARIPMAASDFSTRLYTYDETPEDFDLIHFSLAQEDLGYKIPYLKLAEKLSPHKNLKWFGSTWTPPFWMKFNDSTGYYVLKGKPGEQYYKTLAQYFVKFLDGYKLNGVNIWGLTVLNEPVYSQVVKNLIAPNLGMTPEIQRDFVKYDLGPALEKAGYGPQNFSLMIFDDNIPRLEEYADIILNDKDAAKYVSGIAIHWYSTNDQNRVNIQRTHNKHPNYFLLATEACILQRPKIGSWSNGEKYAHDIIQDLNYNVTGWVDWNMVLDEHGYPRISQSVTFDSPLLINHTSKEYYKQPMYYSMGHFSKFLPPGSVRVALDENSKVNNLFSVALIRPDNATVVIVQNKNQEPVDLTIKSKQGVISHTISAQSLQSYIWKSNN